MSITLHPDRKSSPTAVAEASTSERRPNWSFWSWLRHVGPTAMVMAVLAGLAFWGHLTDWTLPKFSTLIGNATVRVDDWCKDHNVPASQCIECLPELVAALPDFGWCKVHGIAQCPLDHPEIAQLNTPPEITPVILERVQRALTVKPRSENSSRCVLHRRRIQFASVEALAKVGVDIALAQEKPVVEAVVANGEVVYDPTRTASPKSRVAGTVWRVEKQIGDRVQHGDVLVIIDAAEVGKAKSDYLQAMAQVRLKETNLQRLQPLSQERIISGRQFTEAEVEMQEARIRLHSAQQTLINLGLPVSSDSFANLDLDQIALRIQYLGLPEELATTSTSSNLFPLRAALDGVVVNSHVVDGAVIDTTTPLFDLADVSQMWLMLDLRQEDAGFISLGQTVLFRPNDSQSQTPIQGNVDWMSTAVDEQTRTVKVRVNLPNAQGQLRANTFGTGQIVLREEPHATVIPAEAVHWDGSCHVVFVRDKNYFQPNAAKFFHVRPVRLGVTEGNSTEIIAGILPGEVVASKNSVVLEAQLLKSNLGAGCCELHSK